MEHRFIGQTGLKVSRLCFGTLTLSPAQAGFSAEAGGELLVYSYHQGVDFWDTAEIYDTYPHIRTALRRLPKPPVISSKTYAWDASSASASLDKARQAPDLDVIDVFLLHEQESSLTLDGHREAFAWLIEQKDKGLIRAVGISTHAIEPVLALTAAKNPDQSDLSIWQNRDPGPYQYADVIHPLLNFRGIGLLDGSAADMVSACTKAHDAGLGIYGMKMLGGGHLLRDFQAAADFALNLSFADAYAVGMQTEAEVDMNVALFSGQPVSCELLEKTRQRQRRLAIGDWCVGCGACVARCGEHALHIENGRAVADSNRCIFCGYCATVCRDFCIKVV